MKKILSLIVPVLLISCSSSVPPVKISENLLSDENAYSKTTNIFVSMPKNWFVAEDNECNCTDLWLVKKDYSESITFKKINVADSTLKENREGDLERIVFYSKAFVRAKLGEEFKNFYGEEFFELNGKIFSAYKYQNEKNQPVRTVVFKHYEKYFECETVAKDSVLAGELLQIQNAVLSTLN